MSRFKIIIVFLLLMISYHHGMSNSFELTFTASGVSSTYDYVTVENYYRNQTVVIIPYGTTLILTDDVPINPEFPTESVIKVGVDTVYFNFIQGDILIFKAKSGNHRVISSEKITESKTINFNFIDCKDADGNQYPVVVLGDMIWTAANLNTTHFNNGNYIGTTSPAEKSIGREYKPTYQWAYNGDENLTQRYGRLYTGWAVIDSRGIAPNGFRIATKEDWLSLITFLGSNPGEADKMKDLSMMDWGSEFTGNNESGFTARAGGYRSVNAFLGLNMNTIWWTNTLDNGYLLDFRIYSSTPTLSSANSELYLGRYIRCVQNGEIPTVSTNEASEITTRTAFISGNILSEGKSKVTEKGFYWSTEYFEEKSDNKIQSENYYEGYENPAVRDSIRATLNNLTQNTKYYVRAFAKSMEGEAYGNIISFTTQEQTIIELTTNAITNKTGTSVTSGGNILYDRGYPILRRGVVLSKNPNPTINDLKFNEGSGMGAFSVVISGLEPNAEYYIRAYATDHLGTCYGNELKFKFYGKEGTLTDIDGNVYHYITIGNQRWMVENLRTTRFRNGTVIPTTTPVDQPIASEWGMSFNPIYQWPAGGDESNVEKYGRLYTQDAMLSDLLAPEGCRIPTNEDWDELYLYLGGNELAIPQMKDAGSMYWVNDTTARTNTSGFSAVPAGFRYLPGYFIGFGERAVWWSRTFIGGFRQGCWCIESYIKEIRSNSNQFHWSGESRDYAFPVRCIVE